MKTENEYAEALIEKYINEFVFIKEKHSIQCAIIDVENTIKALWDEHKIQYYQNVLKILKDKL